MSLLLCELYVFIVLVNKNHNGIISTLFSDECTLQPTNRMIDVLNIGHLSEGYPGLRKQLRWRAL